MLRFHDPVTGRDLPGSLEAQTRYQEAQTRYQEAQTRYQEARTRYQETQTRYQQTQAHLDREIEARRAAEARIAELEERLGRSS